MDGGGYGGISAVPRLAEVAVEAPSRNNAASPLRDVVEACGEGGIRIDREVEGGQRHQAAFGISQVDSQDIASLGLADL
eukprot:15438265-Alexandrium_andersonii.AAC.1